MSSSNYFKSGDWNAICDSCGGQFKSSQLRKTWDGYMVCSKDYEPRHPQDAVRGKPDKQSKPWTRNDPEPIYLSPGDVTADDL